MKLYYHKTSGGAEYLTDTFIPWKHNGKSGKEGTITDETKVIVRIDGDITKDVEAVLHNADALATALETLAYTVDGLVPEKSRTVKDALSVARAALAAYRGAK